MNKAAFYAAVRARFDQRLTQQQVDGFEAILEASALLPISYRAYLLATAWHETATLMHPVKETVMPGHVNRIPSDAAVAARLEAAWRGKKLPWVKTPYWRRDADGKYWFGRGFVQLTHKANYVAMSKLTGIDLVTNPARALDPRTSAEILVRGCSEGRFTGKALRDYLPGDYLNARRVVNSLDAARMIALYAEDFEAALKKAGAGEGSDLPAITPLPTPAAPPPSPPEAAPGPCGVMGVFARILSLLPMKGNH